jgi:hypothetical protein
MTTNKPSLGSLLHEYLYYIDNSENKASVAPTKSAFVRIVTPALEGPLPKGKRASTHEIDTAFQFLDGIPAEKVESLLNAIDAWDGKKDVQPEQWRSHKSRILAFINWVAQELSASQPTNSLESETTETHVQLELLNDELNSTGEQKSDTTTIGGKSRNSCQSIHRFKPLNRRFRASKGTRRTYARETRLRGKARTKPYSLGCQQFNDYVIEDGKRVLGNAQLQADFEQLELYQKEKLHMRPPSIKKNYDHLRAFYGWLHRYKGVPLSALSFEQQIPTLQLYYPLEECLDDNGIPSFHVKVIREAINKEKAKAAARSLVELFKEFLTFMDGAASSDCAYVGAMLNAAKLQYHDVTDREQYDDFQDVSFVLQLRLLRRERDTQEEPVVPREKKSLPWPKILEVMEHLRVEADTEYLEGYWGPNKEKFYSNRRQDRWIAKSLLKFLIVAFLCIIPPHRSRTIQELEIGSTMLRGAMVDGEFVPAEYLTDDSDVGWWLYLPPEKIKTGKKYGPYWSELPNVQFADGKYFYEYIDRWLNKDRSCFPTNHSRFFTRHCGKPVTAQSLWEYLRDFFMRIAEVPVTPKELRTSFVTYLYDLGIPDYELDAVAFSMHHTRRMQESHYRKQKQLKRTRIAVARSVEIVETIIGIRSVSDESA